MCWSAENDIYFLHVTEMWHVQQNLLAIRKSILLQTETVKKECYSAVIGNYQLLNEEPIGRIGLRRELPAPIQGFRPKDKKSS
jgi:hypothetical protein